MSDAAVAPPLPDLRRDRPYADGSWVAIGATAIFGAAWATACYIPELPRRPIIALLAIVIAAGFLAAAMVVARQPGRRDAGVVLASAGALWPLNSLGGWTVGAMPVVRQLAECVFWLLLVTAVVLYQHPHLNRLDRTFLAWLALQFVGGQLVWIAVSRPEWTGLPADTWWPSLAPDRGIFEATREGLVALYLPSALLLAVLLMARGRRVAPVDRYSIAPVAAAIGIGASAASFSWSAFEGTTVLVAVLLLPLPLSFIYAATRLSRLRIRLSQALDASLTPSHTAPRESVTAALRTVLRDPSLMVSFWSSERGEWLGETGRVRTPHTRPEQIEIAVPRSDGRLSAVVSTRATSLAARREVEAAVRLAGTVLENAGLRAVVQAQAEEVGRAHARTVQAAVEERRRLEQDLHDGAQQRLLGVLTLLALDRCQRNDASDASTLRHAETEIRQALAELRDLAHGLHPTVLTRDGLEAALVDLTARVTTPVDLRVTAGRYNPAVEATLFYVVSEALANVHKHAEAERVWVRLTPADVGVHLEVSDDGVGGADLTGRGMSGLSDRVVALGGRFTCESPAGGGTQIRAWVPCE